VRSLPTKRNSDGTFRNGNKPRKTTVRTVRARWVEAEGLRLKQMGMSYETIAAHITAVGRGLEQPAVALLDGVTFPTNYKISKPSVYLAVKAALAAAPLHEAEEYRQLQTDRCEEMYFAMQPGIRAGSPPHVSSAVKVLQHQADLQGLSAKDTNPGLQAFVINIHCGDDADQQHHAIPLPPAIDVTSTPATQRSRPLSERKVST
jgi:hypothetical protein